MALLIAEGERVFSPTSTFLVGDTTKGAQYSSITAAIQAALETSPSESNRVIIYVSPGEYNEDVFLPDFVYLVGIGAGALLTGDNTLNGIILDVGQCSWVERITIAPTLANKSVGLIIRDAASAIGRKIVNPVIGTLIVSGNNNETQETFTFTGESSTDAVVELINNSAANIRAYNRYGKVALIAKDKLVIYSDGTANAALGFPTTTTRYQRAYESTTYINNVSIIGIGEYTQVQNQKQLLHGIEFEERKYFGCIVNGLSVMGSNGQTTGRGVVIKRGTPLLSSLVCVAHSNGIGIELSDDFSFTDTHTQVAICSAAFAGNGVDVHGESGTKVLGVLFTSPLNSTGSFSFEPWGNLDGFASPSTWNLGNVPASTAIKSLSQYARGIFVTASQMYGASDNTISDFLVKAFADNASSTATFITKHVQTSSGEARSSISVKVTYTLSQNGGTGDVVRISLRLARFSNLNSPGDEVIITQDVDVSSKTTGTRYDIEFSTPSSDAIPLPGEILLVKISREGDHANDTYTGTLYVWGAECSI